MQLTAREFRRLVEDAIDKIPAPFQSKLNNLTFLVETDSPSHDLLGLFEGIPATERSVSMPFSMPDRITIYQKPHERMASDEDELRRLVEETVWHEVAHYFGLDEAEVRRAERRRERDRRIRSRPPRAGR